MLVYCMYRVQNMLVYCTPGYANDDSSRRCPEMSFDVLTKLRQ